MAVWQNKLGAILAGDQPAINTRNLSKYGFSYLDDGKIRAQDGTLSSSAPGGIPIAADVGCQLAVGWGQDDKMWGGQDSSGSWVFGALTNFDGAMFVDAGAISVYDYPGGLPYAAPVHIKKLTIYNQDEGTAWMETNFPVPP